MSIAEVISRTVGPTASKRRTLEREAARIAGELADADRRRPQLSLQAHDRIVMSAGRRDADLDGQIQELRKTAADLRSRQVRCDGEIATLDTAAREAEQAARRARNRRPLDGDPRRDPPPAWETDPRLITAGTAHAKARDRQQAADAALAAAERNVASATGRGGRARATSARTAAVDHLADAEQALEATSAALAACERQARADYVARARPAYVAAVTQLAECLMRAGSANDTLRRHGPVAELLGSSVPAWPELDARLDGWLDAVRAAGVEV